VFTQAQEAFERKQSLQAKGIDSSAVARRVANLLNIDVKVEHGKRIATEYNFSLDDTKLYNLIAFLKFRILTQYALNVNFMHNIRGQS